LQEGEAVLRRLQEGFSSLLRLLPGNAFKKALAGFFCNEGAEGDLGYLGAFW